MQDWHRITVDEAVTQLETQIQTGLTPAVAEQRLEQYGPNELIDRGLKSPWKILWEQLTEVMVLILVVAAGISAFLHEYIDAIVILIIVILNAILGFTQEYRAEQAMAALKKMAVPRVKVRRGGKLTTMDAHLLVPGDVIQLDAGDAIPADSRLIEAVNLRIMEAVLTGESEPVEKITEPLDTEDLGIGDRLNMAFMGTVTTFGRGLAVVTTTGMNTELGKIADLLQTVGNEPTPLQKRLAQLGKGLAVAALIIVGIVFALGLARGEDFRSMLLTGISMAVAAIPEGLTAVVTIALALGAQRMLQRRALIRKLPAVETLGSVTVICSDKTGTLTENRMTVTMVDTAENRIDFLEEVKEYAPSLDRDDPNKLGEISPALALMLVGGALCNDAVLEENEEDPGNFTSVGDPTEGALVIAAAKAGLWKEELLKTMPRVAELPFDSDRKRMTTVHSVDQSQSNTDTQSAFQIIQLENPAPFLSITKGSVDGLLDIATRVWVADKSVDMDETWRERIEAANADMAKNGMRVLGIGYRFCNEPVDPACGKPVEERLTFIGMMGMIDPARPEVRDAVSVAKGAGVRPIMITGDHPLTAMHIAKELNIADAESIALTGQDLAKMDIEDIKARVDHVSVFARVSPEHKLKIVQALQEKNNIVAMTGDGVNDAPALKKANIGVAMGITGTDVSKEASDMVLLDDNFATIVAAIEEGRRIYDNIRKFIKYALTSNMGEVLVMLIGPFIGFPLPLTPLQILWVNLVTDGLPGLALTVEPVEPGTMKRKPHSPSESIFARGLGIDIVLIGLMLAAVSLAAGIYARATGHVETWQTMIFTTLTIAQMGNVMAVRSDTDSTFKIGFFSNRVLVGAVLLTVLLQLAVIYIPFLQGIFNTTALSLTDLLVSVGLSIVLFFGVEIIKWTRRRNLDKYA
ncbi:MAG TPA: cation-translocating P-type ATPase [Bellilinea sp.]